MGGDVVDRMNSRVRLALVIPALNEEEAIGSTLARALAARDEVVARTPVDEMVVVCVNDGSTDGTQAIVDRYSEVVKIRFEHNRGYGAAIKAGFCAVDAELVGFMDADGTCDPRFCVQLVNRLYEVDADVVLGARLNEASEMPLIRRVGNGIFARLVGVVSGESLTDCASGMRVMRRESLRRMVPLPDGLHFTPAMSCIAMLDPRLRIEEVPMPYRERVGRSKLSVVKDGVKFLAIILFASACFTPIRSLGVLGLLFGALGVAVCGLAAWFGASGVVVTALGAAFGLVFAQAVFIGLLIHQLNYLLIGPRRVPGRVAEIINTLFWSKPMIVAGLVILLCGGVAWAAGCALAGRGYAWLWITSALCVAVAGFCALGGVILRVIWAVRERQRAQWEDPFAIRDAAGPGGERPETRLVRPAACTGREMQR